MNSKILELVVIFGILVVVATGFSPVWTKSTSPTHTGEAVAMSGDGKRMISVSSESYPAISLDSGNTWATNGAQVHYWFNHLAASADGVKLAGIFFSTTFNVYVSTDSGYTWTPTTSPVANWRAVASSADGVKLAAAIFNGAIYTSTNSGQTWQLRTVPAKSWTAMASSADGSKLLATASSGEIYASTNSGVTWAGITAPLAAWSSIAASADGSRLVVAGGGVYTSTNSGGNWTPAGVTGNIVASSDDGTRLVVAGGPIFTSDDSGNTWTSNSAPTSWASLASSADGCTLMGGANGQVVWIGRITPTPQLNLVPTNSSLAFSWTLPSTNFVLQQNPGLAGANWVTLTNTPTLNLTNLQEEVGLSPTNSSGFYRLMAQ